MNNPLEAVTQAVNSLVTALKLPDESAKANEVLGEMSFPQFSRLLPYRDYNQESGLFMNDTTMGFMLEAIPINGANESIVEALDHMLRTKLPRGIPLCIHLMSSQLVGDRIEYGLREFSWSGEQAERFNAITRAYYMKAAATQFPLPEGMNLPLTLRHYRVFISYCSPSKKKSRADILEMENLVKIIRASLQGASITTQTVDAQAFIDIVGEMINHNPDSLYRDTYVTQSADKGTCQTYTDNPACTLVSHQCAFYSEEGACLHEYATYSCESKTSGKMMVCGGDVFCLDGECDKAQSGKSNDFAEAVSQLAALAAAGKDVAALNGVDVRAFTGQAKFCKKAAAGYSNCCKDSGWGQDIGLAKCSSDEKALAKAKSNKLTVSVGEFCSKKVLGVCLEKKRSYCQFDSKLAQIVQQQGRNGQLRISFGSAKHPDCRGITVDELQKIQFDRLDFTNFYEDLMNNQKIPDSGVLTQKVKEQIADQLKQAGQ
ncbi:conjugal transfer protein TraN [Escherichia coli]|uniref:conjugal transfer protein TraN n=1 Tax=Escherichia coli TaxID=562 RepID=UPI002915D02A|nr:conjugal transfer protein TraN [Escherichia coli]